MRGSYPSFKNRNFQLSNGTKHVRECCTARARKISRNVSILIQMGVGGLSYRNLFEIYCKCSIHKRTIPYIQIYVPTGLTLTLRHYTIPSTSSRTSTVVVWNNRQLIIFTGIETTNSTWTSGTVHTIPTVW